MTKFAELIDQAGAFMPLSGNPHRNRAIHDLLKEMRTRVARLQAQIDDPNGADELPMVVLEFLEG